MNATIDQCPLCRGSRKLTLAMPSEILPSQRKIETSQVIRQKTYPCPECSTPQNKIGITIGSVQYLAGAGREREIAARKAVDTLFDFIRRENLVTIEFREDSDPLAFVAEASLGVVTDKYQPLVASFVGSRVSEAVSRVVEKAVGDIRAWGSDHEGRHGQISKDEAVKFVMDAARVLGQ